MQTIPTPKLRAQLDELKSYKPFDARDGNEVDRERYRIEAEILRRELMNQ